MISKRLLQLRNELRCTKKELLKNLPLNYSTYANYESGIREPNSETLQTIAKFYNVSIDFIIGATDNRKRIDDILPITNTEYDHICDYRSLDDHGKYVIDFLMKAESERVNPSVSAAPTKNGKKSTEERIPMQVFNQRASAGLGNYLDEYSDEDFEIHSFLADSTTKAADFAVRLKGDSMEPRYKDDDIVCVKSVPRIDPEQVGIFIYEGEAYCKRLKIDRRKGEIYLESLNKHYAPLLIDQPDQLRTVGLVLGVATE